MRMFIAYFDGCCEPVNPGGAMGFGTVVTENGQVVWWLARHSGPEGGMTSNNLAEYAARLALLDYFITQNLVDADIEIRGDSILVIDQMAGRSKIGSGIYASAAWKARELADRFANIKFCWIPPHRKRSRRRII